MPYFIKKILLPILVFCAFFIILLHFIKDYQSVDTSVNYTLKSYKNTVALYKNDEILKIYDDIVLNTLPQKDVLQFNTGIPVTSQSQAETYLEDFE